MILFVVIAVVAAGYGMAIHGTETKTFQGLPFSFYSSTGSTSRPVFVASAFFIDVAVWYLIAYLVIRFYDRSSPV